MPLALEDESQIPTSASQPDAASAVDTLTVEDLLHLETELNILTGNQIRETVSVIVRNNPDLAARLLQEQNFARFIEKLNTQYEQRHAGKPEFSVAAFPLINIPNDVLEKDPFGNKVQKGWGHGHELYASRWFVEPLAYFEISIQRIRSGQKIKDTQFSLSPRRFWSYLEDLANNPAATKLSAEAGAASTASMQQELLIALNWTSEESNQLKIQLDEIQTRVLEKEALQRDEVFKS